MSFEYDRIRKRITAENEVGRISPLIEIELLANQRTIKTLIVNIKENEPINSYYKLYFDYWSIYKDIIRNWGAKNMIRLREIYELSEKLDNKIKLNDINKYTDELVNLDRLLTNHFDAVDKWYNDEKAPSNYIKYALDALNEYKFINIEYLNDIIVEREKYFNEILKNHESYYEGIEAKKNIII